MIRVIPFIGSLRYNAIQVNNMTCDTIQYESSTVHVMP